MKTPRVGESEPGIAGWQCDPNPGTRWGKLSQLGKAVSPNSGRQRVTGSDSAACDANANANHANRHPRRGIGEGQFTRLTLSLLPELYHRGLPVLPHNLDCAVLALPHDSALYSPAFSSSFHLTRSPLRMFAFACRLTRTRPTAIASSFTHRLSLYCSYSSASPVANMTGAALLGGHNNGKKHKVTIVGSGNWYVPLISPTNVA